MFPRIAIVCVVLYPILPGFAQSLRQTSPTGTTSRAAPTSQKSPELAKAVQITKIDARKMTLAVKDDARDSASQTPAKSSGRRSKRDGRRNPESSAARQYKVYLTKDTVFKDGETIISFSSLKVGDRILVTGSGSGSDVQATQVARNSKP